MLNNLFDKNLNSFKPNEQLVAEFLRNNYKKSDEIDVGIELIEGKKIFYVNKNNVTYQLDSLYDSTTFINIWFEQLENRNYRSRFLIFGLGNGMYVRKLLKEIKEEAVVIVYEPSVDIFYKLIQEEDISDILSSKQVHLIVDGVSESRLRYYLGDYLTIEDMLGLIVRSYLNYSLIFAEKYVEFEKTIRFQCDLLNANSTYYERFGSQIFYNFFHNYYYMAKGKSLINLNLVLPKDIPAILVSSGPSLDKNVKLLKKAKNKSFIMAVDSAASVLVQNDIKPDLIMTIDPKKMYTHLSDDLLKKTPLLCTMRSHCVLLEIHKGDKYFLHDDNPYIDEIFMKYKKKLPILSGGGSVATDAYGFLESLKFQTIVLIGQDLAYTNKQTHSLQSKRGKLKEEISEDECLWTEGIDGEKILTSYEFQIYQDWFEEEIRNNPQFKVIDATEGGAKIKGTIIKPLKDVIEQECTKEVNIEEIMNQVVYRLTNDEQEDFLRNIRLLPYIYEKIKIKVNELITKTNKLVSLVKSNKFQGKELKKLYEEILRMVGQIESSPEFYLINSFIQWDLGQEDMDIYAGALDNKEDILQSLNESLKVYAIMKRQLESDNGIIALSKSYIEGELDISKRFIELPEELRENIFCDNPS